MKKGKELKSNEELKSMDCAQSCAFLDVIRGKADKDAAALQEEIDKCYAEKDEAVRKMREAGKKKDQDAYREAFIQHNMLTEYITEQEKNLDMLTDGALLKIEDWQAIHDHMFNECFDILGEAAAEIDGLMKQMNDVLDLALKRVSERNRVLVKLHECMRPKKADGESKTPEVFRDTVITPYLNNLQGLRNEHVAAFRIFTDGYKRKMQGAGGADQPGVNVETVNATEVGRTTADGEVIAE